MPYEQPVGAVLEMPVSESDLKRIIAELRRDGEVRVDGLGRRERSPREVRAGGEGRRVMLRSTRGRQRLGRRLVVRDLPPLGCPMTAPILAWTCRAARPMDHASTPRSCGTSRASETTFGS